MDGIAEMAWRHAKHNCEDWEHVAKYECPNGCPGFYSYWCARCYKSLAEDNEDICPQCAEPGEHHNNAPSMHWTILRAQDS